MAGRGSNGWRQWPLGSALNTKPFCVPCWLQPVLFGTCRQITTGWHGPNRQTMAGIIKPHHHDWSGRWNWVGTVFEEIWVEVGTFAICYQYVDVRNSTGIVILGTLELVRMCTRVTLSDVCFPCTIDANKVHARKIV